jgi:hypothetical protein
MVKMQITVCAKHDSDAHRLARLAIAQAQRRIAEGKLVTWFEIRQLGGHAVVSVDRWTDTEGRAR